MSFCLSLVLIKHVYMCVFQCVCVCMCVYTWWDRGVSELQPFNPISVNLGGCDPWILL